MAHKSGPTDDEIIMESEMANDSGTPLCDSAVRDPNGGWIVCDRRWGHAGWHIFIDELESGDYMRYEWPDDYETKELEAAVKQRMIALAYTD